ncbi:molecular chaperone protein HspA/DnaK, partial [Candidatus Magnetoovum chiemensis]
MHDARFIIGIDLGTTNSVVSYIDTGNEDKYEEMPENIVFKIPQVTDAGVIEELDHLPSFMYLANKSETSGSNLALPWSKDQSYTVGAYAKLRGSQVPSRLVSSAKSWLCHSSVDRTSAILPWNVQETIDKVSPLDVSSYFLNHIKQAWNYNIAKGDKGLFLENQSVFLTVPASFDAVARELTVKAAKMAGFENFTLLEEPQAAFYSWLNRLGDDWRKNVKLGDIILVCDIGGGTTDFSLIEVCDEGGDLALKRIAVGEHILLGGDNMDLTLAYTLKSQFQQKGINLDSYQMLGLIQSCREAKEKMFSDPSISAHPITILGRGRGVIAGTL